MPPSLKYAVVERERRFLLASVPDGIAATVEIDDLYIDGSRLRLREVREADGAITRKLTHKVRISEDASEVACTNFYLSDDEWQVLAVLPGQRLHKTRHSIRCGDLTVLVDVHADGAIVAEIDDGDSTPGPVPEWLDVICEVTSDERWTGAGLARRTAG